MQSDQLPANTSRNPQLKRRIAISKHREDTINVAQKRKMQLESLEPRQLMAADMWQSGYATATSEMLPGTLESEVLSKSLVFTNPENALDADGFGSVDFRDIEAVVGFLNDPNPIGIRPAVIQYLDVNGNGRVTAIDALLIVNYLNQEFTASKELVTIDRCAALDLIDCKLFSELAASQFENVDDSYAATVDQLLAQQDTGIDSKLLITHHPASRIATTAAATDGTDASNSGQQTELELDEHFAGFPGIR